MEQHWLKNGFETCCGKARHFILTTVPIANSIFMVTCPDCIASKKFISDKKAIERELKGIEQ